jgi:hypothetical protein
MPALLKYGTVHLDRELHRKLKIQAVNEERQQKDILADALVEYLAKHGNGYGKNHGRRKQIAS